MTGPANLSATGSASADRLESRLHSLPDALQQALAQLAEPSARIEPIGPLSPADAPIAITGGGMSEGPARFLRALLTEVGFPAQYIPLSEFVAAGFPPALASHADPESGEPGEPRGTLVVFSQGLAPNARFPLVHRRRFRRCILVTAVTPDADPAAGLTARIAASAQRAGWQILTLPPTGEDGLLLRVVGPAVHALAAAYLAGVPLTTLRALPAIYAQAATGSAPTLLHGADLPSVALIAGGRYLDACFGLRWKLLEGLQLPDPPIWDLLQVAHGPLQSIWRRAQTLILLTRAQARHEGPLWRAIATVFAAPQHRIVTIPADRLPGCLAYFEHDAQLNGSLLGTLRGENGSGAERIDLIDWPGRGSDGPLYNLAPTPEDLLKLDHDAEGNA